MADPLPMCHRDRLRKIRRFDQLIVYLQQELGWPIETEDFEELTFEYSPEELGIDTKNAAAIQEIKRLRPLVSDQPWGIFFVKFAPKRLPVVALRRILGQVTLKKRTSANSSERRAWEADDLLFVSNYGDNNERRIALAHFAKPQTFHELPTLKVLGWDNLDTALHLDSVADSLARHLKWPDEEIDPEEWRELWRGAFTLRHREVISTSRVLSERLADLGRKIRDFTQTALNIESDTGPLKKLLKGFRTALMGTLDEASFADMYAQTVVYGLLSARIADPEGRTTKDLAAALQTNPFLRELIETCFRVGGRRNQADGSTIDFDELGISEVVELLNAADMEAVIRDFGDQNPQEDPVIHFYEHFLSAYDKKQKVRRGVFYTPRSIVSYIVRSTDEILRSKFGIADGLADTVTWGEMVKRKEDLVIPKGVSADTAFVQILDPATGTGTFLIEIIDCIHKTMVSKWKDEGHTDTTIHSLWNAYVPEHLLSRLHGYELLMAPYTIAHLKIGLKLYETGYRFNNTERAQVYLTNALEPAADTDQVVLDFMPALAREALAVSSVKREKRFTVIIGNPPYSGISYNKNPWIEGLLKGTNPNATKTSSYFHIDGKPLRERKVWLDDDYVKFVRFSQWLIDQSNIGINAFITNHGYLDNPTFRGMRSSLMSSYDSIQVIDLHGNLNKHETTPDGGRDYNVFDIRQGVAIGLFKKLAAQSCRIDRTDVWGTRAQKYNWLQQHSYHDTKWNKIEPIPSYYLFEHIENAGLDEYSNWASINEIMPISVSGVVTARDHFTIDFDLPELTKRMKLFLDEQIQDDDVQKRLGLQENYAWRVSAARTQLRLVSKKKPLKTFAKEILYRPFDQRHIFWDSSVIWRPRKEAMPHMLANDNIGLLSCRQQKRDNVEWAQVYATTSIVESSAVSNVSGEINYVYPLYLYPGVGKESGLLLSEWPRGKFDRCPNLTRDFVNRFETATGLNFVSDGKGDHQLTFGPEDVLAWIYAVLYSSSFRRRCGEWLKLDFPRLPVPRNSEVFVNLVKAGHDLLSLHVFDFQENYENNTRFNGPTNIVVSRVGWSDNTVWIDAVQTKASDGHIAEIAGSVGFQGVPRDVWEFRIGAYQVCYKWLNDRKGRKLSTRDIFNYQKVVVALRETIRIMIEIEVSIDSFGGWSNAIQSQFVVNS